MTTFITVSGNVQEKLARLRDILLPGPIAAFMAGPIDTYLHDRIDERFANEGDDAVGVWEELKESTQAIRVGLGLPPAHPINVRFGGLKGFVSMPGRVTPDSAGVTLRLPGAKPVRGTATKFRTAQKGSRNKGPFVPPRPVLGMSPVDTAAVMSELELYIIAGTE